MADQTPDHHTPRPERDEHAEKVWDEFWLPIFHDTLKLKVPGEETFTLDDLASFMGAIKKELVDYYYLITEGGRVYEHVSGGMISKPNTMAFEVISAADESYQNNTRLDIKEWIKTMGDGDMTKDELLDSLRESFNIIDDEEN